MFPSPWPIDGIARARRMFSQQPIGGQEREAFCGIGSRDDFESPLAHGYQRVLKLVASMAAIGKDVPQPWEAKAHHFQHIDGAVTVLDVGGVDEDEDQKTAGFGKDVALAALDLLASIITANSG